MPARLTRHTRYTRHTGERQAAVLHSGAMAGPGAGSWLRRVGWGLALVWGASTVAAAEAPGRAVVDPSVRAHSPRIVRLALTGPPDAVALEAARAFDERLMRTERLGPLPVRPVGGAALQRVEAIVARLAATLPRPQAWTVRLLATTPPQDNAFVAGGTVIYVYTGMVDRADSDDELAFVLGHEMAHTLLKHDRRQEADGGQRRLEALRSARQAADRAEPGASAAPMATALQQLAQGMRDAYARADEQEADALGAVLAHRAGYDPSLAVSYFERQLAAQPAAAPAAAAVAVAPTAPASASASPLPRRWARLAARAGQSHPDDAERWLALNAIDEYLDGRRSLASLAGIGQGHRVLQALAALGLSREPPLRRR